MAAFNNLTGYASTMGKSLHRVVYCGEVNCWRIYQGLLIPWAARNSVHLPSIDPVDDVHEIIGPGRMARVQQIELVVPAVDDFAPPPP